MFIRERNSTNTGRTTAQFLKLLGVPVTATTISKTVEEHPEPFSLLCISDALKVWGIENAAYQVDNDELPILPFPFIAQIKKESKKFCVVSSISIGVLRKLRVTRHIFYTLPMDHGVGLD